MCGRFENIAKKEELPGLFGLDEGSLVKGSKSNSQRQFNIAPAGEISVILSDGEKYKMQEMIWGIKFRQDSPLIFNSRIETIKEKPYWTNLFTTNKCVVPMTAFYEWKTEGKSKVPYRIFLEDERIFFVPAIYLKNGNVCFASLITTTPNAFIKNIHHRMPVILKKDQALGFLNGSPEDNFSLCVPFQESDKMRMESVRI